MTSRSSAMPDQKRWPIRPGRVSLQAACVGAFAGCAYSAAIALLAWPGWGFLALFACWCLLLVADAWAAWILTRRVAAEIGFERHLPHALALGVEREIVLRLINQGQRSLRLTIHDFFPSALGVRGLPQDVQLPAGEGRDVHVHVTPVARGAAAFGCAEAWIESPLRLWQSRVRLGKEESIRVYPNFAAVARFALLATDHRLSRIGVKLKRRRGEGMEFHQLREYRAGDTLRQIDWKASTRQQKLISREYQDERDQRLVFLLDGSRRMRAQDGDLTHFDHALNSMMLLAHVALKQGDSVGALSFGDADGGPGRFFAPAKGAGSLERLTNRFYDLEPQVSTGDYLSAATNLMRNIPKRAMVVILTNLRDEDEDELAMAIRVLSAKHLVVVASLREHVLRELSNAPVTTLKQAIDLSATDLYLSQRSATFRRLVTRQSFALDVEPDQLPVALVNQYLAIKRSGRL